jgi:hypothetical protein
VQGWPRFERRRLRRPQSTALGDAGRCGLAAGKTAARAAQGVARGVEVGHREGMCVCALLCGRARGGVHLDGGHGGAVERRCGREEKAGTLNRAGLDRQ